MITLLAMCCILSGHVEAPSGAPLPGATVRIEGSNGSVQQTATSDASGDFTVTLAPGAYDVATGDRGYAGAVVNVAIDHDTKIVVQLEPVDTPTVRTIATVTIDGRLQPVRGTVPTIDITRADMDRLGFSRAIDALQQLPSVTFARPDGGASTAISVIALRGPDPSETLIGLDGQLLNDANTGDVDLSRFPTEAFTTVEVTEGLGPQDRDTSNTIGGIVNFVSLRPTVTPHYAFSLSGGSFGQSEGWFNVTGTRGKLGYAFAGDNQHQTGYVNETQIVNDPTGVNLPSAVHLGSNAFAHSGLANFTYSFNSRTSLDARIFALSDWRDQSSSVNGIDAQNGSATFGQFIGPGAQTLTQNIRAYQVRGRTGLGAGDLTAEFSTSDDTVSLAGGVSNAMYDLTHYDRRTSETLTWGREFERSSFAFGGTARHETFTFEAPGAAPLSQNVESYFARGSIELRSKLRANAALFASRYTTFGNSTDGRIGFVYSPGAYDTIRFSAGTGFRAPLLIERYVFDPADLPPPDANCVITAQGNPNEKPEHATEFELGATHRFSEALLDVALYRTNLRDPIENYYPGKSCPGPAFSYPINIGSVVYQGAEVRFGQRFPKQHLFLQAQYGLNVAYPQSLPLTVSNPTSGATLVNNQQFALIPQQQGAFELDYARDGWHAAGQTIFRGKNNELNRDPFMIANASIGYETRSGLDLTLAGTNIFSDASGRYTYYGGGIPYRGLVADPNDPATSIFGNVPTDLKSVEPFGLRLIFTMRH